MTELYTVINGVANQFLKEPADLTGRGRFLMKILDEEDVFSHGWNGKDATWPTEIRDFQLTPLGPNREITYETIDLLQNFTASWVEYVISKSLGERETWQTKGDTALKNFVADMMPTMKRSAKRGFAHEFTMDSTSAATRLSGYGTILKYTQPANSTTDKIGTPAQTSYAGRSLALGATSGSSWSANLASAERPSANLANDYPYGTGSADYNAHSPLFAHFASDAWETGSRDFEVNCWKVIQFLISRQRHLRGEDGIPTVILLAGDLLEKYQNFCLTMLRNQAPHPRGRDLGFPDTMDQSGVMIQTDYNVPAGTGIGLNCDAVMVASLHDQTFYAKGPKEDPKNGDLLFRTGFFGQAMWLPGYQCGLGDLSTTGTLGNAA